MTRRLTTRGGGFIGALTLATAACLLATVPNAHAEPSKPAQSGEGSDSPKKAAYAVEVMVVHATRLEDREPDQKPIVDERIGELPQLLEEPFSLYDRFDWLGEETLPLEKEAPRRLALPNGRVLKVALLQELKNTVRFSASINRPGKKDFLPLLSVKAHPGKVFIVAGQKYKNGILVLVLRVKK